MRWLVLFLSVFSSISLRAPVAIAAASIARTIVVDLKGGGDFESIQQAIDSVGSPSPTLYLERVGRSCGGVSREKVNVKSTKSYIVLEGDGAQTTSIEWGDYSDSSGRTTDASATFTSYASNFVAKSITFKLLCNTQGCKISTVKSLQKPGYVTAQGRKDSSDSNGFVFKSCTISGPQATYLGRAWKQYSRVIFYQTFMSDIIVPEGWYIWNAKGSE
ncbi:hypothetical protein BHM03_00036098 [Ensete ventricosum]|nr:hypothetical protein BHM03_00036098 [Ensete ventricosum]